MPYVKKLLIEPRENVASFDVDAQNCFTPLCPDELPVQEGHLIASELNAQAAFASVRVGSKDAHSPQAIWVATPQAPVFSAIEGDNVDICWPRHAVPGTLGFELLEGLPSPAAYDFFVWKGVELNMHPYNACYHDQQKKLSTGVIEFLQSRKIKTVIVGGLATDYCVKETVLGLVDAGFKVVLNLAACRGIAEDTVEQALACMRARDVLMISEAACLENRIISTFEAKL